MMQVELLGMLFDTATAPNFGSITINKHGEYSLLSADVTKLNTLLTRQNCGNVFNVAAGSVALVLDSSEIYMYHAGTDQWYKWG